MPYPLSRKTFFPLIRLGLKSIEGIEHVPKDQPFVLAANHLGALDPLFLGAPIVEMTGRLLRFLVDPTKRYWRYFGRFTQWWTHAIPIPTEPGAHEAWHARVKEFLDQGDCIGIFPEGEISHKPHLLPPKAGLVRIAHQANVPILPVGLQRPDLPFRSAFLRTVFGTEGIRLHIGKPIVLPAHLDQTDYPQQANAIMEELSRLSGIPFPSK